MIKAIEAMITDLLQFMSIWVLIIMAFTCVSMLLFGKLTNFQTLGGTFVYWFQSALGAWNFGVFEEDIAYYQLGVIYTILFLLLNVILLLNFVIAILGSTYGYFDEIKTGLFYNVLNQMSSTIEWDDHYGVLLSIKPPVPTYVGLLPFIPFYFYLKGETLKAFNNGLFFALFLPNFMMSVLIFTVINMCCLPVAYLTKLAQYFGSIFSQSTNENMKRAMCHFVIHLFLGPFILMLGVFTNMIDFTHSIFISEQPGDSKYVYKQCSIPSDMIP